jgi:hypothetical protein
MEMADELKEVLVEPTHSTRKKEETIKEASS